MQEGRMLLHSPFFCYAVFCYPKFFCPLSGRNYPPIALRFGAWRSLLPTICFTFYGMKCQKRKIQLKPLGNALQWTVSSARLAGGHENIHAMYMNIHVMYILIRKRNIIIPRRILLFAWRIFLFIFGIIRFVMRICVCKKRLLPKLQQPLSMCRSDDSRHFSICLSPTKVADGTWTRIWRHHEPLHSQFCHSHSTSGAIRTHIFRFVAGKSFR